MNHEEFIRLMREGNEKKISTPAQQLVDYFDKEERATERLIGNFPIKELILKINDLQISAAVKASESFTRSPIFDSIQQTNQSVLKMLGDFALKIPPYDEIIKNVGIRASAWSALNKSLAPQLPINAFLGSHLSQITNTSYLAQSALINIDFSKIGSAISVADEIKTSFSRNFAEFSHSYTNLFKSFELPESSLFTLPPTISKFPTIEYFNEVDLIESTMEVVEEGEYQEERQLVRSEIKESTSDSVIIQLREANPEWIPMLEGAKQALISTNPDKTRHCITSLRELVMHIMHYLSPDEQIKTWSISVEDFHNKKPTRKARLRFITRNIEHDLFKKFIDKDIDAILAAIDLFQTGTHSVKSKLTEAQIFALIARVESTILLLFSTANYKE